MRVVAFHSSNCTEIFQGVLLLCLVAKFTILPLITRIKLIRYLNRILFFRLLTRLVHITAHFNLIASSIVGYISSLFAITPSLEAMFSLMLSKKNGAFSLLPGFLADLFHQSRPLHALKMARLVSHELMCL